MCEDDEEEDEKGADEAMWGRGYSRAAGGDGEI